MIYNNKEEVLVFDIFNKFSFIQMMDKLIKEPDLVFYSNTHLYYMKDKKVKVSYYENIENHNSLTPEAKDLIISNKEIEQEYLLTSLEISEIVSQIQHSEVGTYLKEGYTLMYSLNDIVWCVWVDEDRIHYSTEDLEPDDPNLKDYLCDDLLNSHINGQWFIIDKKIEY